MTDGCDVDGEVMGLWANIESQIYKAIGTGKAAGAQNGVPSRQGTGQATGGLDGYQQEFVANIERRGAGTDGMEVFDVFEPG